MLPPSREIAGRLVFLVRVALPIEFGEVRSSLASATSVEYSQVFASQGLPNVR